MLYGNAVSATTRNVAKPRAIQSGQSLDVNVVLCYKIVEVVQSYYRTDDYIVPEQGLLGSEYTKIW